MNWDKALNTLIIMFLVMNCLLGAGNYAKNVKAYRVSEENITNIKSILKDKGIVFECEVPRSFKPREALWIEPWEIDSKTRDELVKSVFGENTGDMIISKQESKEPYEQPTLVYNKGAEALSFQLNEVSYINQNITKEEGAMKKEEALKIADEFVKNFETKGKFKKVKIDYRIESYGALVTYYEVYNKLPIFDSYIRMEVTPKGIASAVIQGANVIGKIGAAKSLIPIDKVLFDIEEHIDERMPLTIENIQLGYSMKNRSGMLFLEEEAIPMYKIDVKGLSESIFVNAYTK